MKVLGVQGARIALKINVRVTKSFWLGINEGEDMPLGNDEIDQVDSFTYLGSIISKYGEYSEDEKGWKPRRIVFSIVRKKNLEEKFANMIRILEVTVMTKVKYCS